MRVVSYTLNTLLLSLLFSFAAATPRLEVRTDAGELLVQLDLSQNPQFVTTWRHSVTGIVVQDFYALRDGQLLLTDTHAPSFDAGLGHIPGRGRLESDAAHGYWIRGIDEPLAGNGFTLRLGGAELDYQILHAGETYYLGRLAPHARVRVQLLE